MACCLFLLYTAQLQAQPLSAYVNLQKQIMVWDAGMIRKIDYLPPTDMKIGRTTIPYLDNSRSFKIYYNGGVQTINIGFTNEFYPTDNLVAFLNARSLNVFDNGDITNLTTLAGDFYIGDSILLYYDQLHNAYEAYYNGEIYPIENFLAGQAIDIVKVSDNIAAYNNYANHFRIFFQGQLIAQENYEAPDFGVGRNTVAYVDVNRQFKIFHKGKTFVVENFEPLSFAVGDDVVAYVSNDGYFKIFYDDSVQTIGFFQPDYRVGDYVVAFRDGNGFFSAFYKGFISVLENYYPGSYQIQYNSIAYVNSSNILRLYTAGDIYDVTSIFHGGNANTDKSWQLHYDVLQYQVGANFFKIFYRGREY